MTIPDLNLLIAFDVLIEECSVARAAERMGISSPSMSRTLARIRETVGDPVLVRAGRQLVPTERALALRQRVHDAVEQASSVLRPEGPLNLSTLDRRFTIRAGEGVIGALAAGLTARIAAKAPKVVLRFAPEGEKDDDALREGRVDLDIAALREMGPEIRVQTIFRDHVVGIVRSGHPILADTITPESFVQFGQIGVSRRGRTTGPIDRALQTLGLTRRIALIVPSFQSALFALPTSDLIGLVPKHVLRGVVDLGMNLKTFELPLPLETVVIAQAWHPRLDSDSAHRFLRESVRSICAELR
ncbi:LysR family transcriptional regulator [Telmatospirillum siberiense]|uniref:LysR family transcriptional regulator n=1 Tax=Telmatospirillum siberiense TaxID=382514 RepID=A0A2N3PRD4_9PROT|nr:LysR family transcriptional regulator [Telmatospirillum siberiense]PKU22963.1 LysR family transcriptional regulator [Telmatospirillum siberiense]